MGLIQIINTFVLTSADSHSSNVNAKFVKRERDILKTQTTITIKLNKECNAQLYSVTATSKNLPALLWLQRPYIGDCSSSK